MIRIAFDFQATRTKQRRCYRKRVSFRNSRLRQLASGFSNYERWWVLGWDICIKWGAFDPAKPDLAERKRIAQDVERWKLSRKRADELRQRFREPPRLPPVT